MQPGCTTGMGNLIKMEGGKKEICYHSEHMSRSELRSIHGSVYFCDLVQRPEEHVCPTLPKTDPPWGIKFIRHQSAGA